MKKNTLVQFLALGLLVMPAVAFSDGPRVYVKAAVGGSQAKVSTFLGAGTKQKTGPMGQLAVGGEYTFGSGMYVAGEVSAGRDALSIKATDSDGDIVAYKAKGSLGAALQGGYSWDNAHVAYVRAGFERVFWRQNFSVGGSTIPKSFTPTFFVPGVGYKYRLTDNWALGAEYQKGLSKKVTPSSTSQQSAKWSYQRLLLGATYRF